LKSCDLFARLLQPHTGFCLGDCFTNTNLAEQSSET
jgi:hypothetical protein